MFLRRTILAAILLSTAVAFSPAAIAQPKAEAERPVEPGTVIDVINEGTVDPAGIQRLATHLFGRHGPPVIENAARSYRIRFVSTDLEGEAVTVVAQLLVPLLDDPESRPLYAFGSGTTGLADACAPSQEAAYPHALGDYRSYLLSFAGRGFTAIIPDYLGFNDSERTQSYFNARAEAQIMLDAVRAVDSFFERQGTPGDRDVFLGGYSQGGHAAFAAADLRPEYAPELELSGILGFGATTDVESLLREGPFYTPYIVLSYVQDYGEEQFDPKKILAARWLPGLDEAAGRLCVDRVQAHYPFDGSKIYTAEFAAALYGHSLERDFPTIARTLATNSTGLSGHGLPALIAQGENDVIVWTSTQNAFARRLCDAGSPVLYLNFPNARHRETRPVAYEEAIAWMKGIAGDEPPASSCPLVE
jgi:pimeloyl-ACP methyl ester carboxylesterase